jgi:prefoldin subunit 5
VQEEIERMGQFLNTKINTEITVLETKITNVKEQIDQELSEHKEKCNQVEEQVSRLDEMMDEVLTTSADNNAKTNSRFLVAEANLENYKERVALTVKSKCEEVSRRLGERLAALESNHKNLDSEIKNLQERQNQMQTETFRTENFHVERDKSRNEHESEIRMKVSGKPSHQEENFRLSNIEVNLPLFDDSKDANPMFHLKQLEQYFELKGIPQSHRLVIACKSVVGEMSRQWLEAISDNFLDYEEFRQAFVKTWWSPSQQSLEKCKLYQDKYDPTSGMSFSAHFIKYAKTAAYLEPKPTETEVIEAIRYHFPVRIQRILVSTQLNTIGEAVEFLKRLEMLENQVPYQANNGQGRNNAQPTSSRGGPMSRTNNRQVNRVHATNSRRMRSRYRPRSPPFSSERREEDSHPRDQQRPTNSEYREEERRSDYEHDRREN